MRKQDVIAFYRTSNPSLNLAGIAKLIGVTPQAFSQWGEVVPELTARRIQEKTRGRLRLKPDCYKRVRDSA